MTEPARPACQDSKALRVTLFEDRAEVVRRARCQLDRGVHWVAVGGVTAMVDDPSVVARVTPVAPVSMTAAGPAPESRPESRNGPRVIAVRVIRQVRMAPQAQKEEIAAMEADLHAARRRHLQASRALSRAESQRKRCLTLGKGWLDALQRAPRGGAEGLARWRKSYRDVDLALCQALDRVQQQKDEVERAQEDQMRAEVRLKQGEMAHPRYETAVEVQVESPLAQEAEIELTYRTPCALWRPEHLMRLVPRPPATPGSLGHEVHIKTWATVWQCTGEEWRDVLCRFSTARPAQSATPPLLRDDVLVLRRKTEQEKRTVVVEARDQTIAMAGLSHGQRAQKDDEMPGVDDGGEPLWFQALRPATLQSDGQPVRVEISEMHLPATVERVAFPERSQAAHLRATATLPATLTGGGPILAGPILVARGSELFGRGRIDFVGRGEPFEIGFGVDDGIRVRRHVEDRREVTAVIGTQKLSRTVKLYVSNLSSTPRKLIVTERVPVSEVREVDVTLLTSTAGKLDARDGLVRFDVEVPGGGTKELSLSYRIEAAAKVVLPL